MTELAEADAARAEPPRRRPADEAARRPRRRGDRGLRRRRRLGRQARRRARPSTSRARARRRRRHELVGLRATTTASASPRARACVVDEPGPVRDLRRLVTAAPSRCRKSRHSPVADRRSRPTATRPSRRDGPGAPARANAVAVARPPASRTFPAIGVLAQVSVTRPDALDEAAELVAAELRALDLACSRFRDDSELARLNRSAGRPFAAGPLLLDVLAVALGAAAATGGDVDPTVGARDARARLGSRLRARPRGRGAAPHPDRPGRRLAECRARPPARPRDPAGRGRARPRLDRQGLRRRPVRAHRARRDRRRRPRLPRRRPGRRRTSPRRRLVGAHRRRPPRRPDAPGPAVAIRDGGLATSSTTVRRWRAAGAERHHIVDPRTGLPAPEVWRTVTVAAVCCVAANAASTAAIVRGEARVGWLARAPARGAPRPPRRLRRDDPRLAGGGAVHAALTYPPVWYLMRATGIVSLLLLTLVVALGIATSQRARLPGQPRGATRRPAPQRVAARRRRSSRSTC